jgi:hypothetical protein
MKRLATLLCLMSTLTVQAKAQQDTTYTRGTNLGSEIGIYPEYYRLTRIDSLLGVVLRGNDQAGSCANVWCALVPGVALNSLGQSGGTFTSFNDAAHEVVRVWNLAHLSTYKPPVVVPPVDTTHAIDSSYTTIRIVPDPTGAITGYRVYHRDTLVGTAIQAQAGRWSAYPPNRTVAIATYSTLRAASYALVHYYQYPPVVTPPTSRVDTVIVYDTVKTTITITKTVHDTVTRVDTVKVPCDTAASREPELPRFTTEMDAMLKSARASDTVTRMIFDLVGQKLVARKDSTGAYLCGKIVSNGKTEQPIQFVCPQAVIDANKARLIQP